ncbi:50S ribosomal protein L3 N(5)-glutamine methyltransferase [Methyloversatilis sp. XJ19-49]|uniref:50S ribosomal protein L3 N(5)-glutamine methyltransferase n=1 Tax=Methyloversatilis sp. XJ19-49 TaxID=2963429 RepID=UPI00211BAE69|nr:50S ribosomal protein L3 N(5)-glutamine methyltransferase [Methyloversatilis sp. XJ19-49]MCQ9379511.1 50S ribosomal protein L3 N(5)-glutamine methyltransferase [Methyloversatilis sp. XJ19-49]
MTVTAPPELNTVRDWLRYAVSRMRAADVAFGQGFVDAYDEAAYLVLHTLHLPLDRLEPFLDAHLSTPECLAIAQILDRRVTDREPAAYITGEAWLGPLRFKVDPRVIIPRSHIFELMQDGFEPWLDDMGDGPGHVLDLCTGSGCLAITAAHYFPEAQVDAVDLSADALEVAALNVAEHGLADRVELLHGDLFSPLKGRRYDLILSNPPYVTDAAMAALPDEFLREPSMALGAGADGMDIVRRIVADARVHLNPGGLLLVEVGRNQAETEQALPDLPLVWLDTPSASAPVFLLRAEDLG